jgi:serine/threonine-protein kinase
MHEEQSSAPASAEEFAQLLLASGLMNGDELNSFYGGLESRESIADAAMFADLLINAGRLTAYQSQTLRQGHKRGLVLGNYVILEKLGEGGMGMVFKARHKLMKRIVALKVLPPSMTQAGDAVGRFHREVEAAAKLTHPNIAGAFDADESDGIHFLVMEYVDGPNLSSLIKDVGPLTPPVAMNIVAQAARGLAHAHANGVVHRDIKPGNLLVANDGLVKILDMGLAQLQQSEENNGEKGELTQSGRIMGTVDYMAPEQALDAKPVDSRADV